MGDKPTKAESKTEVQDEPTMEEKLQAYQEGIKDRPTTTPEQDAAAEYNKKPQEEREKDAVVHPIGHPLAGGASVPAANRGVQQGVEDPAPRNLERTTTADEAAAHPDARRVDDKSEPKS